MKTRNIAASPEHSALVVKQVPTAQIGVKQGRLNVTERHDHDKDRFDPLLAEFVALGKQAAALDPARRSAMAAEFVAIRSEASGVLSQLLACCKHMDWHDERRRFLAMTLIFTSARGIDLLELDLLHLLDEILPT